jgi:hypothetical protein
LQLVAGVAALLLVIVAGATVAVFVTRSKGASTTGGGTGTGTTAGPAPATQVSPGKYKVTMLPENLCDKVDMGRFATSYDKDATAPSHQRNLSTVVGTATCSLSRQHGTVDSIASLVYTAFVYTDTNLAKQAQQQVRDNAKLNDPALVAVTGVGDEAFVNKMPQNSSTDGKTAQYAMEVRDGNLRWTVYAIVSRITGAAWTKQELTQIVADLEASVKASNTKLTARA